VWAVKSDKRGTRKRPELRELPGVKVNREGLLHDDPFQQDGIRHQVADVATSKIWSIITVRPVAFGAFLLFEPI